MIHTKMESKITLRMYKMLRKCLIAVIFLFLDVRDWLRVKEVGRRVADARLVAELLLLRVVLLLLRVALPVLFGLDFVPEK